MGTNSRPFLASTRGRPRIGALPAENIKMELVCPAVQGRVQCPLKPASMRRGPFGTPMAEPDWPAEERQCCAHSTVTVTLTGPQLQKAQWGPPAGSWEHTLYLEAARSLTERSFSVLKSPHVTGMAHMKWGPRREPMIKILFALRSWTSTPDSPARITSGTSSTRKRQPCFTVWRATTVLLEVATAAPTWWRMDA